MVAATTKTITEDAVVSAGNDGQTSKILDVHWLDQFLLGIIYSKTRSIILGTVHPDDNNSNHQQNQDEDFDHDDDDDDDELLWLSNFWKQNYLQLLYPVLYFFYLYNSQAQTPAVQALGLQVVPLVPTAGETAMKKKETHPQRSLAAASLMTFRVLCWAFVSGGVPFLQEKVRSWIRAREQGYQQPLRNLDDNNIDTTTNNNNNTNEARRLAFRRQFQVAQTVLETMDRLVPIVRLSLLLRVWSTKNSSSSSSPTTVDPAMWISGLAYAAAEASGNNTNDTNNSPRLQVSFAHRRFVWEETVRTVRLWLLDGFSKFHVWKPLLRFLIKPNKGQDNDECCCPVCKTKTILVPMKVSCCGREYCYTCLYKHVGRRGQSQPCISCGYATLTMEGARRAC